MARALGIDRDAVFGKLTRVWMWFDSNSVDGVVVGAVDADVDELVAQCEFANAMRHVDWLASTENDAGLYLPKFSRHNGETSKNRALKNERQARWRGSKDGGESNSPSTQSSTEASTKASTREEKRREELNLTPATAGVVKPGVSPCPHEQIIELYHQCLPELPEVANWTETRKRYLQARWREKPSRQNLDWWKRFFEFIKESDFLCGRAPGTNGKKPFRADLEWIITQGNFVKIVERKYHQE